MNNNKNDYGFSTTELILKSNSDVEYKYWELCNRIEYKSEITNETYIIEKGFISDLITIPSIFCIFSFKKVDNYLISAILHDFLIKNNYDKSIYNSVFIESLKYTKISRFRTFLIKIMFKLYFGK